MISAESALAAYEHQREASLAKATAYDHERLAALALGLAGDAHRCGALGALYRELAGDYERMASGVRERLDQERGTNGTANKA